MDKYSKIIKELHKETKYLFKNIRLIAFDFDGVFTDNVVYTDENGRETVRSSRLDGIGLNKLKNLNVNSIVLSSEQSSTIITSKKDLEWLWFSRPLSRFIILFSSFLATIITDTFKELGASSPKYSGTFSHPDLSRIKSNT